MTDIVLIPNIREQKVSSPRHHFYHPQSFGMPHAGETFLLMSGGFHKLEKASCPRQEEKKCLRKVPALSRKLSQVGDSLLPAELSFRPVFVLYCFSIGSYSN
ncbi:MAG: hypothetical protein ACERIH_01180 [Labilibaculum antarcticum]